MAESDPKLRRKDVYFQPEDWERLESYCEQKEFRAGTFIVKAALDALEQRMPSKPEMRSDRREVPLLGDVPCGPLREALNDTRHVDIGEVYDTMNVGPNDFFLEARGTSMRSNNPFRDIPEGSWILFRPGYFTGASDIVLIRVDTSDGQSQHTVKRLSEREVFGGIDLAAVNGQGQDIEFPEDSFAMVVAMKWGLILPHEQPFNPATVPNDATDFVKQAIGRKQNKDKS